MKHQVDTCISTGALKKLRACQQQAIPREILKGRVYDFSTCTAAVFEIDLVALKILKASDRSLHVASKSWLARTIFFSFDKRRL